MSGKTLAMIFCNSLLACLTDDKNSSALMEIITSPLLKFAPGLNLLLLKFIFP